ncbi:hypothetical protein GS506_19120 [Rhodococcus hoagii]|nr:hypothetical protein [Prescottella equi]
MTIWGGPAGGRPEVSGITRSRTRIGPGGTCGNRHGSQRPRRSSTSNRNLPTSA